MFGLKKPASPAHPLGERDLKELARRLQTLLPLPADDAPLHLSLDECQDIIARLHHHNGWAEVEQQHERLRVDPLAPALLSAPSADVLGSRAYLPLGYENNSGHGKLKRTVWAQTVTQALDQTLLLGSSGAGKTETLISMGAAALDQQSGLIYFDANGDSSLFTKMFALALDKGLLDRLFVINFMTGHRNVHDSTTKLSNTLNPMESWDAHDLLAWCHTWLTHDLQGTSPLGTDAERLLEQVLSLLVNGRDERLWALDVQRLGQALHFDGLLALVNDERLSPAKRAPLQHVLNEVLSLSPAQPFWADLDRARSRHAPLVQPMADRCETMARSYGYIFNAHVHPDNGEWLASEINLDAVLEQRQLLLCLLPALEKSVDELARLGQMVLGGVQVAIARRARRLARARVGRVNTMLIVDGAGYFMLPDVNDLVLTAPKAEVACVWGAQDFPALVIKSPDKAQALAQSCGTKLFMKCEDPSHTMMLYQSASFRGVLNHRAPRDHATTWKDLQDQHPGEAWAVSNGHAIPLKMIYTSPKRPEKIWLHRPALEYLGQVQDRPTLPSGR